MRLQGKRFTISITAAAVASALIVSIMQAESASAMDRGGRSGGHSSASRSKSPSPAVKQAYRQHWQARNYEPQDGGLADVVAHVENTGEGGDVIFFLPGVAEPFKLRAYKPFGQSDAVHFSNPDNSMQIYRVREAGGDRGLHGPILMGMRNAEEIFVPLSKLSDVHFRPASKKV